MQKNLIRNALGCLILINIIGGCANTQEQRIDRIEISAKPIDRPAPIVPTADILNLSTVDWYIITPDNIEQRFNDLRYANQPAVFIALTPNGYANLSENLSDIRTYIAQQEIIIKTYKNSYKAN
jgi:hypothetical protein